MEIEGRNKSDRRDKRGSTNMTFRKVVNRKELMDTEAM